MNKINLALACLLLSSCAGVDKDQLVEQYSKLSLEELNPEYLRVLSCKVEAFNERMGTNNVFFALGSVSGLVSGLGKTPFVRGSFSEQ